MRKTLLLLTLSLTLTACGSPQTETIRKTVTPVENPRIKQLDDAFQQCVNAHDDAGATRAAVNRSTDHRTLTTNSIAAYECIARELDAPASLTSRVENTTGTMGGQSFTVDGFDWIWSFNANDTPEFDLTVTIP
jgi:hypothetical protein